MKYLKKYLPCAVPCTVILALSVAGALSRNNLCIYAMIAMICIVAVLASFNKVKESYYPYFIWSIGLSLLLQSTLIGAGLIGSDVHTEYYFYNRALDGWDYTQPHPYNSAMGSTVLAPFLTNVFGIPGVWIFKLIIPLLFSLVPVLLYYVFKKEFSAKVAFFACVFFLIVPTWSMEMIGIPRQMLGELMLALCLFVIIVSKWRMRIKIPLLIVLGILGATFHYIMGPMIILYLVISTFFLLFSKRRVIAVKWMSLVVAVLVACNVFYYGAVCQGLPLTCLTTGSDIVANLVVSILPDSFSFLKPDVNIPWYPYMEPGTEYPEGMLEEIELVVDIDIPGEEDTAPEDNGSGSHLPSFISKTDAVIKAAWGADFMDVNAWGKVFRVFQYITQICVVIGCVILFRDRKKYSAEYLSFCWAAVLLLGACMFIPHFAALINATRFYHLALFLLAPVFILGGMFVFRNFKILTLCLVIPYFLFTSGVVFELTKQPDISEINVPYSISLSEERVDMVGVFTDNDVKVRDWAVDAGIATSMYSDTHTQLLLWEKAYTYWRDFRYALWTGKFATGNYIFLSERNNREGNIILRPLQSRGVVSGVRVICPYDEIGLDKVIAEGTIIYQQGDAYILEINK